MNILLSDGDAEEIATLLKEHSYKPEVTAMMEVLMNQWCMNNFCMPSDDFVKLIKQEYPEKFL